MLAKLQKMIALTLLLSALCWIALTASYSAALMLAGLLVLLFGHAVFLAVEFVMVYFVNQHDKAPAASVTTLLRAWLHESWLAPQVFLWQQPFRSQAISDVLKPGQRGVVFVHGFVCNRGFWNPWMHRLQGGQHAFAAVSLEPVFGSINDYVPMIDAAVTRMTQCTGMPPLIVCHSMGGLAVRAWLDAHQSDDRVHHVVTIGSPHHGTWLGQYAFSINGTQMQQHGQWLKQLESRESAQRHQLFTCFYSNCDNIVFPTSTATLAGADNRLVAGLPHVAMAFDNAVMDASLALLVSTSTSATTATTPAPAGS